MSETKPNTKPDTEELSLPVIQNDEAVVQRLALMAKALSDPIRIRMLQAMARGRDCCGLPGSMASQVPGEGAPEGICVCEFQGFYGLGQSKVSYHLKVLKEAGLIREEGRGKWSFYSVNRQAIADLMTLCCGQFGL